jgi:metal-dependent amidase/aminoacylase/carboxypeptidase family protein
VSSAELVRLTPELDAWLWEPWRSLHLTAELSLQEVNRSRLVAGQERELGLEHRTGVAGDGRSRCCWKRWWQQVSRLGRRPVVAA